MCANKPNQLFSLLFLLIINFSYSQTVQVSADSIVNYSKHFLGTQYKYGHHSPSTGFDCSGFVYYIYNHFNIEVPRSSMHYEGKGKVVSIDSARKGDIIVFTGTDHTRKRPGHVGIVISEMGEKLLFIHSSSSEKKSGVKITNYSLSPGYQKRFIRIIRLNNVN